MYAGLALVYMEIKQFFETFVISHPTVPSDCISYACRAPLLHCCPSQCFKLMYSSFRNKLFYRLLSPSIEEWLRTEEAREKASNEEKHVNEQSEHGNGSEKVNGTACVEEEDGTDVEQGDGTEEDGTDVEQEDGTECVEQEEDGKMSAEEPKRQPAILAYGKQMEPIIREIYERKSGNRVFRPVCQKDCGIPDGFAETKEGLVGIVEFKTTSVPPSKRAYHGVLMSHMFQVQLYMYYYHCSWAHVVIYYDGDAVIIPQTFDISFVEGGIYGCLYQSVKDRVMPAREQPWMFVNRWKSYNFPPEPTKKHKVQQPMLLVPTKKHKRQPLEKRDVLQCETKYVFGCELID